MLNSSELKDHTHTFVVELGVGGLSIIAALLHEFLDEAEVQDRQVEQARLALNNLVNQTSCIEQDKNKHKIYTKRTGRELSAPLIIITKDDDEVIFDNNYLIEVQTYYAEYFNQ